ncbi:hypothetical protein L249_1842 [Ophiocordyceps polyrhachis-furcata BCC 54312]|uniref:Phosphoribosylaminoimidazole carboxylase n=1 Tax=Ophiocordyceps polyrhachis-furcata BCC 54312 TaxID=1330021 RepID=A0A367LRW9_9HYPO|nr:hypothetical protein L249_1842 [Ophiocordyceps polyrhachis-furcata BCC 54312]
MASRPVIGLLGGGQLGRMLCEAAGPLGYQVSVLDEADCPARMAAGGRQRHVTGSFKDADRVRELAKNCDVLTVEIEHVDVDVLEEVATQGVLLADGRLKRVPVHPSWRTLRLVQDKFLQKQHFQFNDIPVAQQLVVQINDLRASLDEAARTLGFPLIVKARRDSYDGRGNYKVAAPEDIEPAIQALGRMPLYAEKWVPFVTELAVMVIRTEDDDGQCTGLFPYPTVETVHEDQVCKTVLMPPRNVSSVVCLAAQRLAQDVVRCLWGRGVFAVELFLLEDGSLIVNEVAPRPHNSGHYTIEAVSYMSQFKAQLCAVLDLIPPSLELKPRVAQAAMINILGGAAANSHVDLVRLAETHYAEDRDVYLHLYGKSSKPGRKIGHITVTTPSPIDLEQAITPFVDGVDQIRRGRLSSSATQLRPDTMMTTGSKTSSRDRGAPLVVVTMGSDSDLDVLSAGLDVLERFGVPYDCTITSAHRTPQRMAALARSASSRGVQVIIAAAGGAAHLPGMLASETTLPVIGVPVRATHLDGNDSLLSIVQMPRGVPVATVGINNATNAALLAVKILGAHHGEFRHKMARYMDGLKRDVESKAAKLEDIGYEAYLAEMSSRT